MSDFENGDVICDGGTAHIEDPCKFRIFHLHPFAPSGGPSAARDRTRRPARCDRRDRAAAADRDRADRARSSGLPRPAAGADRVREGGHPEAWRCLRRRAAGARRARGGRGARRRGRGAAHRPRPRRQARRTAGRLEVRVGERRLDLPLPVLLGCHQIDNAGLAVTAALALGDLQPGAAAIAIGLRQAHWPARSSGCGAGRWSTFCPRAGSSGWMAAIPGRGRGAGGEPERPGCRPSHPARPLHLIVGMLDHEDERGFLAPLAPLAARSRPCPCRTSRAAAIRSRRPAGGRARLVGNPAQDVESVLRAIVEAEPAPARVLICGSLYLAARPAQQRSSGAAAPAGGPGLGAILLAAGGDCRRGRWWSTAVEGLTMTDSIRSGGVGLLALLWLFRPPSQAAARRPSPSREDPGRRSCWSRRWPRRSRIREP